MQFKIKKFLDFFIATNLRQNLAVFFLFFISLFSVFWPGLGGGGIFGQRFAISQLYPIFSFFSESLKAGNNFPLWLTYLSGAPSYLSQWGLFHPLNILYKFSDYVLAYNLLVFINFVLAGLFVYFLTKDLGLSKTASFTAGIVYVFSEINLRWGMVNVVANAILFIPLLFLSLSKLHRTVNFKQKLIFTFVAFMNLTIALFSSLMQLAVYGVFAGFVFVVFLGVCDYNKEKKFYQNFKTVKIFAAILLISFLIAGPWILSVFNFVKLSTRSAGIESSGQDVINVFLRPGDIVNLFMPDVS